MATGILVVGSINLDMVAIAPRMPGPGENVHATSFQMVAGGKGANQAAACFANAAGAVAVTVVGAQPSMPNRRQVEALVGFLALERRRL